MLGSIIGDIIGSVYEVNNHRSTEFELFRSDSHVSDDSVLTIAVADALLNEKAYFDCYRTWGRQFPNAGYGKFFKEWLHSDSNESGKSFGNGSAMRVSPVAWYCNSLEDVLKEAERSALPTHNHSDAIVGAKAIASCVFLTRTGSTKDQIGTYVEKTGSWRKC
jgi:ADP-ribosylglycohydrolase